MELFREEHKKIWRRSYVRITVLALFLYVAILGGVLQYQWLAFGSWQDGGSYNMDGFDMIRQRQEHARVYGGVLDDESLQEIVRDYQIYSNEGEGVNLKVTDSAVLNAWLSALYPELYDASRWGTMAYYADVTKLTDLYERRQQALENFLEASGTKGAERELILSMNEQVQTPFRYAWTGGWSNLLASALPDLGTMMALGLIICLAPLFSSEWHDRTGTMLLSMKHGWRTDAAAKLVAGFCFTGELFVLLTAAYLIPQFLYLGTEGADMPIQCIKMLAVAPFTMAQAEVYELFLLFAGSLGFAGLVMLLSASSRSSITSLIGSAMLLIVPLALSSYLPYRAQLILNLFPLAGGADDIFRTYTLPLFGGAVWLPNAMPAVAFLFAAVSAPLVLRQWARRQRV